MPERYRRLFVKIRRRLLSRHLVFTRFVLAAVVILLVWGLFAGIRLIATRSALGEYAKMAGNFLFLPDGTVKEHQDRTNILLLGKAGSEPELTDTMILVSAGEVDTTLISIPRDIWVADFKDKINSAYWRGNEKGEGGGLVLAKSVVEEVVGVPIHYTIAFDFEGFTDVVDIVGGVEVDVKKAFADTKFPIPGRENDDCDGPSEAEAGDPEFSCRYETVSFEEGLQLMDAATALKFARSRQSEDPEEGTDLARAARQQKIILAIKDKVLSSDVLLSPAKLSRLWTSFWAVIETDLSRPQMAYLARLAFGARDSVFSHTVPEELLLNPPYSPEYNNLYVFIPKEGSWAEVHRWVLSIF